MTALAFLLGSVASAAFAGEPSNQVVAWKFAQAIKDGKAPAFGGQVPVSDRQQAKLAVLAGCDFERMPVSTSARSVFVWHCPKGKEGDDYLTEVFFDGHRALGIDVSMAIRVHN